MSCGLPKTGRSWLRVGSGFLLQPVAAVEVLKIILLCIASAVADGIVHDQVTARVCVEYFTIGHPPLVDTESPTLLAFAWGFVATWWAWAILGVPAALLSQLGSWPKCSAASLLRPIALLLTVMACSALLSGVVFYWLANTNRMVRLEPLAEDIPASKHADFIADSGAHLASYGVGFVGGMTVCAWIVFRRWRADRTLRALR